MESAGGIRYQVFDYALNKIGAELALNSTVISSQVDVFLQSLQSGRVLATWGDHSGVGGDSSMSSIKGQLLDANGQKIGGEFLVNTTTAGDQIHSSAVAWPPARCWSSGKTRPASSPAASSWASCSIRTAPRSAASSSSKPIISQP